MRLPPLSHVPPCLDRGDLHNGLEAMLAGLRCDPPVALAVADLEQAEAEVERLLVEVEQAAP